MDIKEFNKLTVDVRMKPKVREAVMRILVQGETWAKSCAETDVNESVIKYAIDRMKRPICKCCGQRIKTKKNE
jgi:hypothetical protein